MKFSITKTVDPFEDTTCYFVWIDSKIKLSTFNAAEAEKEYNRLVELGKSGAKITRETLIETEI